MYLKTRNNITHLAVGDGVRFSAKLHNRWPKPVADGHCKRKINPKDKMPPKQTLLERKFVLFVFHQILKKRRDKIE